MQIIRDIEACRSALGWRRSQRRAGMVLASSNLHPGHLAIINECRRESDISVVCIYPKPLEHPESPAAISTRNSDSAQLDALNVDFLFLPEPHSLIPSIADSAASIVLPAPDHAVLGKLYPGSAEVTAMLKLINIVSPEYLFAGERDFLAFTVCRRLIKELVLPIEFCPVAIVREADGLPAAADLQHLSPEQRQQACVIPQTLKDLAHAIARGARNYRKLEQTAKLALKRAGLDVGYVTVCDETTLAQPSCSSTRLRILARARLGLASISDNLSVAL